MPLFAVPLTLTLTGLPEPSSAEQEPVSSLWPLKSLLGAKLVASGMFWEDCHLLWLYVIFFLSYLSSSISQSVVYPKPT